MYTVLGLSVTPTNVQTVLVEGRDADGATLGHDDFDTFGGATPSRACEQVAEAVLGIAEASGQTLHAIGVTWSDEADLEASMLLDALDAAGLSNVVAVHRTRAVEALAHSIGRVIGYQRTAVCLVEPEVAMLSWIDTEHHDVQTIVSRAVDCDDRLVDWVSAMFDRHGWRPEGLFLVGSVGGFEATTRYLEAGLAVPVFDPPEAELALAHGAALAAAAGTPVTAAAPRGRALAAPLAMLAAGAVTFVVSVSLALGMQLAPERAGPRVQEHAVTDTVGTSAAAEPKPAAPAPAAPQAPVPAARVINEVPAPQAPVGALPVPPAAPVIDETPAEIVPRAPVGLAPEPVYVPPAPPAAVPVAPPPPPPAMAPTVPDVANQKPRLRDRILQKIPGLNRLAD